MIGCFRNPDRRKGQSLIEFTLVGIPLLFMVTTVVTVAIDMWQYDNLVFAAQSTARYVAMHGRSCIQDGTSCTLTVANVVSYFTSHAIALDANKAKVTLQSASSSTVCEPVSSCSASASQFPPAADNGVNFDVTVKVTYPITNPIGMFWPGSGTVRTSTFTLLGMSRQRILF